jgi:hypothetical protein
VCQSLESSLVEYPLFISHINKELEELDYSLRITHDERDGSPWLIFVNAKQDPMTETATNFKATEISYIRELVKKKTTTARSTSPTPNSFSNIFHIVRKYCYCG